MPRILIVDDEPPVLRLLGRIIEGRGDACTLAANVSEAKRSLKERTFDLLLCDILMPGESGLDLIRYAAGRYPGTCAVVVSGVEDAGISQSALDLGVYGYIVKPFDARQVLISVANALRRQALERRESAYRKELESEVEERTVELRKAKEQLEARAQELKRMNSALHVLLKKRDEDRAALEEAILSNVKHRIGPYLEKLMRSGLNREQEDLAGLLDSNLKDLVSPMVKNLSSAYLGLTPTELQVAGLIKQGKGIKEIASALNLSGNTIMSHRYSLRTKLGLKNKKVNLRTYLQSLE